MDRSLTFALLVTWGIAAHAGSGGEELSIHSKSIAAATALAVSPGAVKLAEAPFTSAHARDLLPELLLREELDRRGAAPGCETNAADICYDAREARIVYKAARQYMPTVPGLRPESISLRHDRIVLKYSFR